MKMLRYIYVSLAAVAILSACEKEIDSSGTGGGSGSGNVTLNFSPTIEDLSRSATSDIGNYFTKLNVQVFDQAGNKVFDKVKTQTSSDEGFGQMKLQLAAGSYTVVAVGHSSTISATIKSPTVCQFTASNGEKLTDTFCHCSKIEVGEDGDSFTLSMYRAVAMIQLCFSDETTPDNFAHVKMEYTGGSANFNPSTLEGITKSSQSETRATNGLNIYQAYTFPYMAVSGVLKLTVTALDTDGNVIRKREFENVPVTRNRISTYNGRFFEDGDGEFTMSDFGFVVHADWDGEDIYEF